MKIDKNEDPEIFALTQDQLNLVNEFSEKINKKLVEIYIENPYIDKYVVGGDLADQFRGFSKKCQDAFFRIVEKSGHKNVEFKIKMEIDGKNIEEKNYLIFS